MCDWVTVSSVRTAARSPAKSNILKGLIPGQLAPLLFFHRRKSGLGTIDDGPFGCFLAAFLRCEPIFTTESMRPQRSVATMGSPKPIIFTSIKIPIRSAGEKKAMIPEIAAALQNRPPITAAIEVRALVIARYSKARLAKPKMIIPHAKRRPAHRLAAAIPQSRGLDLVWLTICIRFLWHIWPKSERGTPGRCNYSVTAGQFPFRPSGASGPAPAPRELGAGRRCRFQGSCCVYP